MNTAPILDYRLQLRKALESRSAKNPRYSMRAFAKQIGMSPSHLCRVINGQKDISANAALKIASELNLRGKETEHFLDLVRLATTNGSAKDNLQRRIEKKSRRLQRKAIELDQFHLIADWYHFVLFELVKTKGFRSDAKWIAKKLSVSLAEAKAAVDRLCALSLLKISPQGQIETVDNATLETSDDISSIAIKKHHEQMSLKAIEAVKEQPVTEREFQSVQFACAEENTARAKEAIREFAAKFEDEFGPQGGEDVFQLNVQFFRITQKAKE